MKVEKFKHVGVDENGVCESGGAVNTGGGFRFGHNCNLPKCHCSDGYWACLSLPRTLDGKVEGIAVKFKNKEEWEEAKRVWKVKYKDYSHGED